MLSEIILKDVAQRCDRFAPDSLEEKTILVTGSSGLIGTYLLAYLHLLDCRGARVKVYAQSVGAPPAHTLELLRGKQIMPLQLDLADPAQLCQLPEADVIIHSAGYAQPLMFMANPVATLQINTTATFELLKRLKPGGSFVFMSSAEVYCGLSGAPFTEAQVGTSTPYHPRAAYIEGKRCGEAICAAFCAQGARAISIRLGDIYGPGTRRHDQRALNSFIERALLEQKIALRDAGAAMRTYCYAADALELVLQILFAGKHQVYNVGGLSYTSIADVARLIGEITGVEVVFPAQSAEVAGAPPVLRLDLARVMGEFAKADFLPLQEGLERTIAWQKELYAGE